MYAQNSIKGTVEYTISYNATNKKKLPETKKNEYLIKIVKNVRDVVAYLNFTEKESLFQVEKAMGSDAEKGINLTRIFTGANSVFYFNIVDDKRLSQREFLGDLFLISKQPLEWEIKQESKQIGDYICFKAIKKDTLATNKKTIAWFTPQIPVNFGPYEFNGLPGLVLEVNHHIVNYRATKVELHPKIFEKIKKTKKGKKVTQTEFKEITREAGKGILWNN
jgi:GLPGLI family protein